MNFKKKMKIRLFTSIAYVIIGLALIAICLFSSVNNDTYLAVGIMLTVAGILRTIQYFKILTDEKSMQSHEIAETDERNVMLMYKARSLTFTISICLAGTAVIALYVMDLAFAGQIVAYAMCALVLIYAICYAVISRKY